jgi:oligoendopeptidase F
MFGRECLSYPGMFSPLLVTNIKGEPMNKRILSIFLCLLSILTANLPAQTSKVPNYSNTPPEGHSNRIQWKIEDIYASDAEWEKDKTAMVALIAQIDRKKADWTKSPQNMLAMFDLLTNINKKANRLSSYANHQNASELSNSHYRILQGELQAILVDYNSKLAFKNDDLVKMDEKTLLGYFKKEPKLEPYRFTVQQILRSKKHILRRTSRKSWP